MKYIIRPMVFLLLILSLIPFLILLSGSFMTDFELLKIIEPIKSQTGDFVSWHFLPVYPTVESLKKMCIDTPEYYKLFWNSILIEVLALIGQLFILSFATWGLTRIRNDKARYSIMIMYLVAAVIPFQVLMLSWYMIIYKMGFMDSVAGIVIPTCFSPIYIFLMYNSFKRVPDSVVDAARLDGASSLRIFFLIVFPMVRDSVIAALILAFFEIWNMIELPGLMLSSKTKWPLSLYLPSLEGNDPGFAFAFSIFNILPVFIIFICGINYLMNGINLFEEES